MSADRDLHLRDAFETAAVPRRGSHKKTHVAGHVAPEVMREVELPGPELFDRGTTEATGEP